MKHDTLSQGENKRRSGGERREELARIAYRQIAERGFEGLRMRDVAVLAGINNATLVYHFPSKEDLIQGVVAYMQSELQTTRLPRPCEGATSPLEELRYEFEDLRYRFRETPDIFTVISELSVRARRSPEIARIMERLDAGWRGYLMSILVRGIAAGQFRADLDAFETAGSIMAQLKTVGYQAAMGPTEGDLDRLVAQLGAQIEHWLTTTPRSAAV